MSTSLYDKGLTSFCIQQTAAAIRLSPAEHQWLLSPNKKKKHTLEMCPLLSLLGNLGPVKEGRTPPLMPTWKSNYTTTPYVEQ